MAAAQDPHGTQVAPSSRSRFLTGGFCFVFPTIGRFATWRFYLGIARFARRGGGMVGSLREHAITCRRTIPLPYKVELPRLV